MQREKRIEEFKQWIASANYTELDIELLRTSREVSEAYEKFMLLRQAVIDWENSQKGFKVKVKGNILIINHEDQPNTPKLQKFVKSISYNTVETFVADSDEDFDIAYENEPIITVHKRFIEISTDRLVFEKVEFSNNDIHYDLRIDSENGDYLFVNYNKDTGLYHGNVQEFRIKGQD